MKSPIAHEKASSEAYVAPACHESMYVSRNLPWSQDLQTEISAQAA
jgi:hypothetical protein